jgi:hypothetical protein
VGAAGGYDSGESGGSATDESPEHSLSLPSWPPASPTGNALRRRFGPDLYTGIGGNRRVEPDLSTGIEENREVESDTGPVRAAGGYDSGDAVDLL